jgi:hypothetical protein
MPSDEDRLEALAERLRGEVTELQGRWEASSRPSGGGCGSSRTPWSCCGRTRHQRNRGEARSKGLRSAGANAGGTVGQGRLSSVPIGPGDAGKRILKGMIRARLQERGRGVFCELRQVGEWCWGA